MFQVIQSHCGFTMEEAKTSTCTSPKGYHVVLQRSSLPTDIQLVLPSLTAPLICCVCAKAWNVVASREPGAHAEYGCGNAWLLQVLVCPRCKCRTVAWLLISGTWPLCLSGCQTCRLRFVKYLSSFASKDTIHCGVSSRGLAIKASFFSFRQEHFAHSLFR